MQKTGVCALFGTLILFGTVGAQEHNGVTLIEPSLIADTETLVPGRAVTVALRLDIAEGWHTYWENPGDSGIPATVDWDVPEGVRVGPIQWPVPKKVEEPGNLKVYAFKDEVVLLARVFTPADLELDEVTIRATADWLVCRESCIPGDAELELTLPVGTETSPVNRELFAEFRDRLPRRFALDDHGMRTAWKRDGNTLHLLLGNVPAGASVDFFPLPGAGVLTGHASEADSWTGDTDFSPDRVLAIPLEAGPSDLEKLAGVLILQEDGNDKKAWLF